MMVWTSCLAQAAPYQCEFLALHVARARMIMITMRVVDVAKWRSRRSRGRETQRLRLTPMLSLSHLAYLLCIEVHSCAVRKMRSH